MSRPRPPAMLALALLLLAGGGASAAASTGGPGVKHLRYRFGPLAVTPGQNTIKLDPTRLRPRVPGYITRFKPNLEYANGRIPRVDVIHLHHGVWLIDGETRFAVGEEKTIADLPTGFGWRYTPRQAWFINYMIHNLTPGRATVYITYEIDFVPDRSPAARGMRTVRTQWMDVAGPRAYPVFDVLRPLGLDGTYAFPDDSPGSPAVGAQSRWVVERPATLVQTAAHLHPGGLYGYLTVTRGDRTVRIFTSRARYWEPAGPVSWDMAMTATPPDWRVKVLPGDVVAVHAVYDSRRADWYESMGIMPIAVQDGGAGRDPFTQAIPQRGRLTHGRLAENRVHGGRPIGLPDPRRLPDGPVASAPVTISNFAFSQGDLTAAGAAARPPVVPRGRSLTFVNRDAHVREDGGIFHTITACRAPCNRSTGIAYPLADGPVPFDSGELGFGPRYFTAAANRDSWQTPADLAPGTYTYFCRIHPFMRGSFRVAG